MNWRGRTVEYSRGPAKRPHLEVAFADFGRFVGNCPICRRAWRHDGKGAVALNGWGLAQNNPIF